MAFFSSACMLITTQTNRDIAMQVTLIFSFLRTLLPFCVLVSLAIAGCTAPVQQQMVQRSQPSLPLGNNLQQTKADPDLLLNRITWGANASSAAQLATLGADKYLHQQLISTRQTQLPVDIQSQIDAMTISQQPLTQLIFTLEAQRDAAAKMKGTDDTLRKAYQQELTRLAREAASRSLLRSIYSPNQLFEQMNNFWMNHFNISSRKENLRAMLGDFEEHAIRPYALGNFRDLLRATVLHPAMLRYLDNEHNAANRINENYARELMELHTMGVGSGYSQSDVQELARVLTGVGINLKVENTKVRPELQKYYVRNGLFEFHPQRHDFGEKQILGQRITERGIAEIDQVLTLLTRQSATAKFISRKLAMYFVSDNPSETLVNNMAQNFLQTDGDIPSVLKTMFDSSEFIASLGHKFKDPRHYVISSIRLAYDGKAIQNTEPILNWLNTLGQAAKGHQTPDGYSMNEDAWASPAQMTARFDIAKIIARRVPRLFTEAKADSMSNEATAVRDFPKPELVTDHYVKQLSTKLSATTQTALTQSSNPQEWNTFFLAAPEMMRR
jgi:uncharacterized protein (DUF1800 family)